MRHLILCSFVLLLSACGKPNGISDAEYAKYKEFGSPKILFSCATPNFLSSAALDELRDKGLASIEQCRTIEGTIEAKKACADKVLKDAERVVKDIPPTIEIGYRVGVGMGATYNKILGEAKKDCRGEFSILERSE